MGDFREHCMRGDKLDAFYRHPVPPGAASFRARSRSQTPVFFNDRLQPLMVSSLEQTLDEDDGFANSSFQEHTDSQSSESLEHTSYESSYYDHRGEPTRSAEESNEKLYDLLLKILKVLDDQAYRDAERNRRLEQLRNPGALSLEYEPGCADDDGSWMEATAAMH